MIEILIADDHPIVLFGTQTFLLEKGYRVIASCTNGIEAYNQILAKDPAIALMDISMPGMSGLEVTKKLAKAPIRTRFVLLTMQNELAIINYAREIGVKGFLLKEFAIQELDNCLKEVLGGNEYYSPLLTDATHISHPGATERALGVNGTQDDLLSHLSFAEKKVLSLISEQKSSKEIARMLFVSEKTIETHRGHIIKKLGIPSEKNALLKWAIEKGREGRLKL